MVQLAGHHPDRQRQEPAQPGDLGHRRIVRAQPGPARQPDQQRGRLAGRQRVQADRGGVLQRGQVAAAGDQHQAAAGAGQQRPDLLAAGRVIQHQQQLPLGQPVPPQRHPRLQARRDLRGGNPGGQQQAGQRVGRVDRLLPGRVPVQRQEDLPAGEPVRQPVRGVHRERGLAHPGHPADRVDAHHPARTRRTPSASSCSSCCRPVNEAISRGSVRVAAADPASSGTGTAPARPRAAASNSARAGPVRRSASASSRAVSWRGVAADPPLQVADRPRAQPRRLRQLLLGQPGLGAQFPQ